MAECEVFICREEVEREGMICERCSQKAESGSSKVWCCDCCKRVVAVESGVGSGTNLLEPDQCPYCNEHDEFVREFWTLRGGSFQEG